ncbi:UDP-N-acetylglucosamine 2-epimerase, partial [Winogradskyella poriferorum]|uniref:UDP-N-acetylglucosamine 2-epimerase n=1 Tax=Winogradskyella poriferorum TaxID=307627 RepID=UPI003D65562A
MPKKELEKSLDLKFNKTAVLITFHPVTLENSTAEEQFNALLQAIDEIKDCTLIFTKANSDKGGRIINQMIDDYVNKNKLKAVGFASLGQLRYLSTL